MINNKGNQNSINWALLCSAYSDFSVAQHITGIAMPFYPLTELNT